jgi:hypothetical protein
VLINYYELWKFLVKEKRWIKEDYTRVFPSLIAGVRGGVRDNKNVTWFFNGPPCFPSLIY